MRINEISKNNIPLVIIHNEAPNSSFQKDIEKKHILKEKNSNSLNSTLTNNDIYHDEKVMREHESRLVSMLMFETSESGIVNPSEDYFANLISQNRYLALNCILKIFMDYLTASKGKQLNILVNILHMLSHFEYEQVYPIGQAIAIAGVNHKDPEVCDYSMKCFENWEHPDGIEKLKAIRVNRDWAYERSEWLIEYADYIINELNE